MNARLNRLLKLNGLLDRNERADLHVCQAFAGLDNDLNVLALLAGGGEEREIAEFREHPAKFRLKNDDNRHRQERRKRPKNPLQNLQLQQARNNQGCQENDQKASDHGRAARAADKTEHVVNSDRQDQNLQRGPPGAFKMFDDIHALFSLRHHGFSHAHSLNCLRNIVRPNQLHTSFDRQDVAGERRR